jgi:hypothetical protein
MPNDCLGSDVKVEPFECDLNGTVNCVTCGREGLQTVRKVLADGKTELHVEAHEPLPRTFRRRGSPPKRDRPRGYRSGR